MSSQIIIVHIIINIDKQKMVLINLDINQLKGNLIENNNVHKK